MQVYFFLIPKILFKINLILFEQYKNFKEKFACIKWNKIHLHYFLIK